jgi:hypothetical protein
MVLFSEEEFEKARGKELLKCSCSNCNKIHYLSKTAINCLRRKSRVHNREMYYSCSRECAAELSLKARGFEKVIAKLVTCGNCHKEFYKLPKDIKKTKNNFCSQSCSATYHNTHKTKGYRRSKLEFWLEGRLSKLYPNLNILYCNKNIINSELDIYIPSLKLAFELNGIFHYEPIFGIEKLKQIKNNDNRKFQACLEKGIELCIIDTSNQSYFKEKTSQKYLDIITNVLNLKLGKSATTRT